MSFREEFLEKISGFSSERLRTEQRLLEQESDSSPEQISQLDEKLKSLEEEKEKFWSEHKPFRDEINTIQKNIEDRKKILSHDFLSIPYNKRGKNSYTGFIYSGINDE